MLGGTKIVHRHTQTHTHTHRHTEAYFISLVFLWKCRNKTKNGRGIERHLPTTQVCHLARRRVSLRHIQMKWKKNQNIHFRLVWSLYVLAMLTRRPDDAALCLFHFCLFPAFQGLPYYIMSLLYDLAGGSACRQGQHLVPANRVYSSKLKSH